MHKIRLLNRIIEQVRKYLKMVQDEFRRNQVGSYNLLYLPKSVVCDCGIRGTRPDAAESSGHTK